LANEIGLDEEVRAAIMRAADNLPYADQQLRIRILDACGLLMPEPHSTIQ